MKNSRKLLNLLLVVTIALVSIISASLSQVLPPGAVQAQAVIYVPDDYPTIQGAGVFDSGALDISVSDSPDPFNPLYETSIITITNNEVSTTICSEVTLSIEGTNRTWQWENVVPSSSIQAIWDGRDSEGNIVPAGTYAYIAIGYGSWADTETGTITVVLSNTWYVPDDYTTIQAAVDAARPGDTIIVRDGTYTENVDVNKDHLTIQSENGAEVTIVQAANLYHVFHVTADYVKINGFNVTETTNACGIYLDNVQFCNISENIASSNIHGIMLYDSSYINVIKNDLYSNARGIGLRYSSYNNITNNNISDNYNEGIWMNYSSNNNIMSNNINWNSLHGIFLGVSSNNNINGNNISYNMFGIGLQLSNGNVIMNNNINSNLAIVHDGIVFYHSSSNNKIYLNNFQNFRNVHFLYEDLANTWNSPSQITYAYNDNTYAGYLGNYYSDYAGSDSDGDGIGDSPYPIDGDGDNYPLVEPFESYEIGPADTAPPTCAIQLREQGTTTQIAKVDTGQFFDIYVGKSTDDIGIGGVHFSSDDSQDGIPTGVWTGWYDWDSSSGDWDASTRTKSWSFATTGDKEVWVELKDDVGQTSRCSAAIEASSWSFAIITDLHIGRGYPDYGGEGWNDSGTAGQDYYLTERLEREVQTIIDLANINDIRFVVVLGDISDSGEYSELEKARDILDSLNYDADGDGRLDMVYIPIIGNHDVWPYTQDSEASHPLPSFSDEVFHDQFGILEAYFGEENWEKQPGIVHQNYAFSVGALEFMCLDFVSRNHALLGLGKGSSPKGALHAETIEWLEGHLQDGKPTILLDHHPLIWWGNDGPVSAFDAEDIVQVGQIIEDSGSNVLANFAGHIHGFYDEYLPFVPGINPNFMNANTNYDESFSAAGIPVVTTEALMVASNEPGPKGIIRIVNVTGGEIQDYNMFEGEVAARAVNPYFKAEVQEPSLADLFGPYWRELIAGEVRVDFEGYAFTKRVSEDYPIAYHWDFGDGAGKTYLIDDWTEKCNVEPYFYAAQPGRTYDVTLTVEGFTPEGEAIQESLTRIVSLPQRLVIQAACPVDIAVTDPDGLTIDKQSNEISGAIYGERDVNGDGEPDDVIVIPHRKIGDYIITVIPEPDASPTDTFSLVITVGNETATLVEDTPLGDIPSEPYAIRSTEEATLLIFPVAVANGPYASTEGSPITFDATGSYDPDGITTLYEWDFDDDGTYDFASPSPTASHTWWDDSSGNVTLRVTDNDGLTSFDIAPATVLNVAPIVGNITAPLDPVPVNKPINTGGNFTDPGFLDTHTAVWDWGDGNVTAGTVTEIKGSGNVTGSHAYTTPGVYTVTLSVTDDDGGTGESIFRYVVVYDPSAGFVTGGGWIDSLAGAYAPDTSLTGKATFGFVSRYRKGASVPTGQTEFQFHVANMNFKSTSYQWLVIARARAMYKGTGTINGEGNYGFMLSAIDEKLTPSTDVDLFRIRIWDKDNDDTIVYDNQMGDYDYADLTTAISGGSIVIHAK